jgi:hypothetical protein
MVNKYFFILVSFLCSQNIYAQEKIILAPNEINSGQSRTAIISQIAVKKDIVISYSSSQFENKVIDNLPQKTLELKYFLEEIFDDYNITLTKISDNKYILLVKEANISISGYIFSNTGEVLPGATIINKNTENAVFSDEKGFYFIESKPGSVDLEIRFVGHKLILFHDQRRRSFIENHTLENTSVLPVFEKKERQLTDPLTEILPISNSTSSNTVLGDKDPLNSLKTLPGVLPGGEGLSGLNVRGGGPDQSLVMLEGMPIYETYHTGSLSSIFIDESIRSVDFMKSGLPARYGGRLNSVINIQLKDGNNAQRKSSMNLGLQGITFFTQGPIKSDNFTYGVSLRKSWVNTLIKPFKDKFLVYDDININYQDAQLKLCYRIKSTQKLSFAYYTGRDKLSLFKNLFLKNNNTFIEETNTFSSANNLISCNYDHLLNNKIKLNIQAGFLNYKVFSRGQYSYLGNAIDTFTNYLDVVNQTKIRDLQFTSNLDYYHSDNIKIKYGAGYVAHSFNPAVKQSIAKVKEIIEQFGDQDSAIIATELFGYVEGNFKFKDLIFVPGFYMVNYNSENVNLPSIQPRFQLYYKPIETLNFNASYTNAAQYIHLLTNSGLGLPSELWVPSTNKVPAEKINHLSFGTKYDLTNNLNIALGFYNKSFSNLIDYIEPVDQFLNVINPSNTTPILNSQRDWERKVEIGKGRAFGYEASIKYTSDKLQTWISYHYGRSFRTFENINDGLEFISKYDKPQNLSIGATYITSRNWQYGFNWVYTSGQPFTLANEVFSAPFDPKFVGIKFLQATGRNNYRMPAFHQLSLNASHQFKVKQIEAKFNFGLYNVYNRLNSFYIYSVDLKDSYKFFKVSIFPILPQMSLIFSW